MMSKAVPVAIIIFILGLYSSQAFAVSKSSQRSADYNKVAVSELPTRLSRLLPRVIERQADLLQMQALNFIVEKSSIGPEGTDGRRSNAATFSSKTPVEN